MITLGTANFADADEPFNLDLFTDLGTPVRRNALYNHALGKDAEGNERYYQAYRGDPWFLLSLDPYTGEADEYIAEGYVGNPWGILWASNDKLYITTGGSREIDDIFVFDPETSTLSYLGRPTETEQVVWTLCEAEDGKLYGGTYPSAKLVSVDLQTHKLTDLGRMSPDQMYIRFLDTKGEWVYCNAGPSRAAVWAYNIYTGEKRQILPDRFREGPGSGGAQKRADGEMYISIDGGKEIFRVVNGTELEPVDTMPPPRPENLQGNPTKARLTLQDGTSILVDNQTGPEKRYFLQRPDQEIVTISFEYAGTVGSILWSLQEGPDGLVYGTTSSPITLFSVEPATDEVEVLGDPIGVAGQVYGWVWHEDKLYMAAYGNSRLTVWDPRKPWNFGFEEDSNPRYLGCCHIGRPASLIVAPDGKHLLAGGVPGYGSTGGVLTVIEPDEPNVEAIPGLFGEQSIASMVAIPDTDLVCIGTTYHGGTASEAQVSDPRLLLWDFNTRDIVFETVPVAGEASLVQMVLLGDKIYGTTAGDEGYLFAFDIESRQVVHTAPLGYGAGSLFGLRYREADGMLYAISGDSIVRIDPESYTTERLGTYPGMGFGMGLAGDYIYLCAGPNLIKFSIPRQDDND